MKAIEALTATQIKKTPELAPGDTVRVHTKIIEGSKERIQVYEGVVIRVKGGGIKQTFTVRKLSYGIGVERTFLINSPKLAKIEIKKRATVRRAYLTYLRALRGKAAKLKDLKFDILAVNTLPEELKPEDLAPITDEVLTEIIAEQAAEEIEVSVEVSTEDIADAENADSEAEDIVTDEALSQDHQMDAEVEVAEGLEKAEADIEDGQANEGAEAEVNPEEVVSEETAGTEEEAK